MGHQWVRPPFGQWVRVPQSACEKHLEVLFQLASFEDVAAPAGQQLQPSRMLPAPLELDGMVA